MLKLTNKTWKAFKTTAESHVVLALEPDEDNICYGYSTLWDLLDGMRAPKLVHLDASKSQHESEGEKPVAQLLANAPQLKKLKHLELLLPESPAQLEAFVKHAAKYKHLNTLVLHGVFPDERVRSTLGKVVRFPKKLVVAKNPKAAMTLLSRKLPARGDDFRGALGGLAASVARTKSKFNIFPEFVSATFELTRVGRDEDAVSLFETIRDGRLVPERNRYAAQLAHQLVSHGFADSAFDVSVRERLDGNQLNDVLTTLGGGFVAANQAPPAEAAQRFVERLCTERPKLAKKVDVERLLYGLRKRRAQKQLERVTQLLKKAGNALA